MSDKDKSVSEELNDMKVPLTENKTSSTSSSNDLLLFFIGMVHSSWYIWRIGGFDLSSGTVTIPLIIGIIWYFFNSKSIIPKIIITLSVIFIIVTIIMSVRINFVTTSMFDYILIFGMAGAGSGLLLKTLFKKRD